MSFLYQSMRHWKSIEIYTVLDQSYKNLVAEDQLFLTNYGNVGTLKNEIVV